MGRERMGMQKEYCRPNWREEIHGHARPECLPVHWGGTLKDPKTGDPLCSSCITVPPGAVDPSFFLTSIAEENSAFKARSPILDVSAWKSNAIPVKIDRPKSILNFQFLADGDYGFGVFYLAEKNVDYSQIVEKKSNHGKINFDNVITIYPFFDRIPGPNYTVEKCKFYCHRVGYYLLYFSNEFSWMSHLKNLRLASGMAKRFFPVSFRRTPSLARKMELTPSLARKV
uniref:Uncharacterized protein n=1 Tax=Romanomermis culicivorax TaxID=13658 RepID=A0A915KFM8_ROMCU